MTLSLEIIQGVIIMTGIYKITNLINNKCYIGRAKDINERWKVHRKRAFMPSDKEYDKYLYRAFRKYGLQNFKFEIAEICSEEQLDEKEREYIIKFHSNEEQYGYNCTSGYDSPQYGVSGEQHPNHKLTEEEVYYIRECYNKHCNKDDIFNEFKDIINFTGFHKVWNGTTWPNIHMDVYTEENKAYYAFQRNSHPGDKNPRAKLTNEDVYNIRVRKKKGEKMADVFNDYKNTGITQGSFRNVWCYQNWKNIIVE